MVEVPPVPFVSAAPAVLGLVLLLDVEALLAVVRGRRCLCILMFTRSLSIVLLFTRSFSIALVFTRSFSIVLVLTRSFSIVFVFTLSFSMVGTRTVPWLIFFFVLVPFVSFNLFQELITLHKYVSDHIAPYFMDIYNYYLENEGKAVSFVSLYFFIALAKLVLCASRTFIKTVGVRKLSC